MALGFLYGVLACMIWGFVYLVPEVLPGYPPELMAAGRFVSFGLVAVPLAWMERREFAHYTVKDWIDVSKLGVIGNIAYYWCLIECIQNAGVPVAGMAMSAVPVLVAAVSNIRDKKKGTALAWSRLVPGLTLIVCGFVMVAALMLFVAGVILSSLLAKDKRDFEFHLQQAAVWKAKARRR